MPYIASELRESASRFPETVGELNYAISSLVNDWMLANGISYKTLNEVGGVLHYVQSEFDRCVAGPYEQEKRELNGDVWTCIDAPVPPITDEYLESLKIHDEAGNEASKCGVDCGLQFVGEGVTHCEFCKPED